MATALQVGYPMVRLPADVRPPWRAGDWWDQTDAQRELHLATEPLVVLSAGYRAGKTRGLVMESIFLALENLGCVVLVVSPTYVLSRDVIEPEMEDALTACGLVEGEHWSYAKQARTYRLYGGKRRGGSDIRLRSAEHPKRIVGQTVAAALLDEPALMSAEAFKFVRRRVSDPKAKRRCVVLAGTPDPGTWFADMTERPPEGARVIRASTRGNPWIDQAYLDEMAADYDAKALQAYMDGRPVSLTGNAYHAFSDANVARCEYDPSAPLYLSMDNNRDPLVAVLAQREGSVVKVVGEAFVRGGSWPSLAEAVHHALGGERPAGIYFHGDATCRGAVSSEATDWGAFADVKAHLVRLFPGLQVAMRCPKANPLELNRVLSLNGLLCNVRGEHRLLIDPSCVELLKDLREMAVDEQGRLKKPGRPGGGGVHKMRSHLSDALGYLVHAEWPSGGPDRRRRLQVVAAPLPKPGRGR